MKRIRQSPKLLFCRGLPPIDRSVNWFRHSTAHIIPTMHYVVVLPARALAHPNFSNIVPRQACCSISWAWCVWYWYMGSRPQDRGLPERHRGSALHLSTMTLAPFTDSDTLGWCNGALAVLRIAIEAQLLYCPTASAGSKDLPWSAVIFVRAKTHRPCSTAWIFHTPVKCAAALIARRQPAPGRAVHRCCCLPGYSTHRRKYSTCACEDLPTTPPARWKRKLILVRPGRRHFQRRGQCAPS